jgi:hypothetical protein
MVNISSYIHIFEPFDHSSRKLPQVLPAQGHPNHFVQQRPTDPPAGSAHAGMQLFEMQCDLKTMAEPRMTWEHPFGEPTCLPARAVRPTRWMYCALSVGMPTCSRGRMH